jgi:hypothetical protein
MVRQIIDDGTKTHERLNRRFPVHGIDLAEIAFFGGFRVSIEPPLGVNNLQRKGAGRQDQRQKCVRIQRDGG